VDLGVRKIRLTGGEPLLRRQLPRLVEMLASIDGVDDLALTTNGHLLAAQARSLADAGLDRVTVSLDAIDDEVVRQMIDTDVPVSVVFDGIDAAAEAGLGPIKVNTVVRRGWNEDQVLPIIERFRDTPHTVRFIEFMDVGTTNGWDASDVVTSAELVERIGRQWTLEPIGRSYAGEVAERYRFVDGRGSVGFISSVSQPFCSDCTRLRLSAEGSLYTCLFATDGTDTKGPLRSGIDDDALRELIGGVWRRRTDRYSELRGGVALPMPTTIRSRVEMSYIGG
jgi:cyclic pyranopterin phosphate synthase